MTELHDPLKLSESELLELWYEGEFNEHFQTVEESDWVDHGKSSSAEVIFKDLSTGNFYRFEVDRSGSYFSSYEFEVYDKPVEVELVEKTITVQRWEEV